MAIKVEGLPALQKKLGKLATIEYLKDPMKDSLFVLEKRLSIYPPARSGSTYRRTDLLGNSWTTRTKTTSSTITGEAGNPVEYAPLVMADPKGGSSITQAWMHKGRWATDLEILEEKTKAMARIFNTAIVEELAK